MKWRCTRCGKPHAGNDPPCDACGHDVFEEAIVREGADDQRSESTPGTVDTGTTYVWRCRNCGRDHVRFTPPCSRCGNHDLEKVEQTYDDVDRDLETPSWLEVARPYAPILVVLAVVAALFAAGIVPPSIVPGLGAPSPPDAPGEGAEAAGIDLEATETEVHERLAEEREGDGRSYDGGLAAYAEYQNRRLVAVDYDDAEPGDTPSPGEFDLDCGGDELRGAPLRLADSSIDGYADEGALADDVAAALLESRFGDAVRAGYAAEGLDVHVAPDGTIYVFYAVC